MVNISKCRFGELKNTANCGNIKRYADVDNAITKRNMGEEELCRGEYTLRNLTHDVDIECVQLGKG